MLKPLFLFVFASSLSLRCSASDTKTAVLYVTIDERSDDCNTYTTGLKNPVSALLGHERSPCLAIAEGLLFHAEGLESKAR